MAETRGGQDMASLYEHAGRDEALHRLEEIFYTRSSRIRC
jgi:truncated hemoglobin YjbI